MKHYHNNADYIADKIQQLEKEFQTFGTVNGNDLITILSLANNIDDDKKTLQKVFDFAEKIFLQIIQRNCKIKSIIRTPYYNPEVPDQDTYTDKYGYFLPDNYPSIIEFYKANSITDLTHIMTIKNNMPERDRHDSHH